MLIWASEFKYKATTELDFDIKMASTSKYWSLVQNSDKYRQINSLFVDPIKQALEMLL